MKWDNNNINIIKWDYRSPVEKVGESIQFLRQLSPQPFPKSYLQECP